MAVCEIRAPSFEGITVSLRNDPIASIVGDAPGLGLFSGSTNQTSMAAPNPLQLSKRSTAQATDGGGFLAVGRTLRNASGLHNWGNP